MSRKRKVEKEKEVESLVPVSDALTLLQMWRRQKTTRQAMMSFSPLLIQLQLQTLTGQLFEKSHLYKKIIRAGCTTADICHDQDKTWKREWRQLLKSLKGIAHVTMESDQGLSDTEWKGWHLHSSIEFKEFPWDHWRDMGLHNDASPGRFDADTRLIVSPCLLLDHWQGEDFEMVRIPWPQHPDWVVELWMPYRWSTFELKAELLKEAWTEAIAQRGVVILPHVTTSTTTCKETEFLMGQLIEEEGELTLSTIELEPDMRETMESHLKRTKHLPKRTNDEETKVDLDLFNIPLHCEHAVHWGFEQLPKASADPDANVQSAEFQMVCDCPFYVVVQHAPTRTILTVHIWFPANSRHLLNRPSQ